MPCVNFSKDCELLADKLNAAGITAAHYHADMEPAARAASHTAWSNGSVKVGPQLFGCVYVVFLEKKIAQSGLTRGTFDLGTIWS